MVTIVIQSGRTPFAAQSFYGKVVGWDVQDASGVWGSPGAPLRYQGLDANDR